MRWRLRLRLRLRLRFRLRLQLCLCLCLLLLLLQLLQVLLMLLMTLGVRPSLEDGMVPADAKGLLVVDGRGRSRAVKRGNAVEEVVGQRAARPSTLRLLSWRRLRVRRPRRVEVRIRGVVHVPRKGWI